MAAGHYKSEELSNTGIEEDEIKQITSGTYFVDIDAILNSEIEEAEFKPCSEYGVSNESLENIEKCYDPNSGKFEDMMRNSFDEPKESPTPECPRIIEICDNKTFDGLSGELTKPRVNHFRNGVTLKYENHPEYIDDLWTNNAELKIETVKTEDDIDIIYDDVKPEMCEEKPDLIIGPEIEENFCRELSIESGLRPQQSTASKENGTALKRENDSRMEPTITRNSKNCQIIPSEKKPTCKYYTKLYPFESKQEFNERPHTGEKLYQCKICSKSFVLKYYMSRHETFHTREKPFQCKICPKRFLKKYDLLRHERIHTGEKPFECKVCLKSFAKRGVLIRHEKIHKAEKPFQCKMCLKSFTVKYSLVEHERIHTGEKPFKCQICLKIFAQRSSLILHLRMHTGEKPFQCQICPKSFSVKSNLLKHHRIHTGEKPFQCKICSKSFNQKGILMRHGRIHTEKKPL